MLVTVYAGLLISSILYGIVIVLFFQCMAALFDRVHRRREGIKWGLVSYTVLMFSFVTVFTVMNALNAWSADENVASAKGRVGYIVADLMFLLNYWLADGLSLCRCYVIYAMNNWVIAFPSLMYLASVAMGIMFLISEGGGWGHFSATATLDFGLPYLLIAVSLNIVLTLLIVIRLAMHSRNVSSAMGVPGGIGGSYKTIIVVLVESSALYALSSLLVIGLWAVGTGNVFLPILAETQVIAPLLIIQRVANQSALASNANAAGRMRTPTVRSQGGSMRGSVSRYRTHSGGYPMSLVDKDGKESELEFRVETAIHLHPDTISKMPHPYAATPDITR